MRPVLAAAKACVSRGWPVFPAHPDSKAPLTAHGFHDASRDKATILAWWKQHPDALLALPTGRVTGLLVVDIDPAGAEWYAEKALELRCGYVVRTRRGHHLYYRMPEADVRNSTSALAPGIDVRAEGGYVIAWWAHDHETVGELDDIAPAPDWLLTLLQSGVHANGSARSSSNSRNSSSSNGQRKIGAGERNDWLASFAGRLRAQGLGGEALAAALLATNAERLDPPLAESEVRKIAASYMRYDAPEHEVPDTDEPEPLRRPVPPAGEYPLDALGDILGPVARRIAEVVQAPPAVCGQAVLAAASLACQELADVLIDGRREPLSLWCISIAESGERKSAADDVALDPHRAYEREQADRYRSALIEYEAAHAAHEAAQAATKKQKDAAFIEAGLRTLGAGPDAPLKPWLLVSTPTVEGMHKLMRDGRPGLGLFHNDAGEFLGGHAMRDENRMKSAAGLSKLWDRGEFDRIRGGDGADKCYGRRLAMHLMVQPVVAETILGDAMLTGQGFLARCLLSWPPSRIGGRAYAEVDLSADPAFAKYRAVVERLLRREPTLRLDTRNELEPPTLALEPAAKRRWIELHDELEATMRDGREYATVRAWASKAPAQILRIAGVLSLVAGEPSITIDAIERGAALVLHALDEAARIIGSCEVPEETKHAQLLIDWCHAARTELLHSGAALQYGPYAIRTKAAFDAAIRIAERAGWAIPVDGGAEIDGKRRRRVWRIVP